jgi:hypothetical protein
LRDTVKELLGKAKEENLLKFYNVMATAVSVAGL